MTKRLLVKLSGFTVDQMSEVTQKLNAHVQEQGKNGFRFELPEDAEGARLTDPVTVALIAGGATLLSSLISAAALVYVSNSRQNQPQPTPESVKIIVTLRGLKSSKNLNVTAGVNGECKVDEEEVRNAERECGDINELNFKMGK